MNPLSILQLIMALVQVTPQLAEDVVSLWEGTPQQQNEADDAYVLRVYSLIDTNAAKVKAEDSAIEQG